MKKKGLKIILIACFLLISITMLYAKYDRNNSQDQTSLDELENAIIIDGLSMESEEAPSDEDVPESDTRKEQGVIIFDNSFDDSFDHADPAYEPPQKNRIPQKHSMSTVLRQLQKKDDRWHTTEHVIRKGEHLWGIAHQYTISHLLIIKMNNIKNPDMLRPGKKILIPNKNGLYYKVRKNDTLTAIAQKYKSSVEKISVHNNIKQDLIKIGQTLFIPDGSKPEKRKYTARTKIVPKNTEQGEQNKNTLNRYTALNFRWPLLGRITSPFGSRKDPFSGKRKFHCGIDISANVGCSVKAAAGGKIIFSGWKNGYGKIIVIQHKHGYISVYAHLHKLLKQKNELVTKGEQIGLSGNTGAVTGAHLHFEIRKHLTPLNPLRILQ